MNNKKTAEEIVDSFNLDGFLTDLELLKSSIEQALDKAAGKVEKKTKFKLWDHVLFSGGRGGVISYLHVHEDSICYVVVPGNKDISINCDASDLRIDPAFSHTLHFVDHDGSDGSPIDRSVEVWVEYLSGDVAKGLSYSFGDWYNVKRYAVVTEDFLK